MENTKIFAVIRTRGDAWQPALSLEQQVDWRGHAVFMNGLQKEGFVVLGGPLEGTPDVLLIIRSSTQDEIRARLEADPWTSLDLLRVSRISPWTIRLGSLPA
ncbi:MAG TPA: hypothetical protein VLW25_09160 [Bryobacteraceae bacterium]|nr:hypothetical protein [Bryobacteraceae bacterium]